MQNNILKTLKGNEIIPVVTFNDVKEVELVVDKLIKKNISCIEITLRNEFALDCIRQCIKIAPEGFKIGVGTITNYTQIQKCKELNVDFMVSPGSNVELIEEMYKSEISFIPGVMTPSEIITAINLNCLFLKLFPFNIAGGENALVNYSKVFPKVKFCPTGGLNAENYSKILSLDNVLAVGGSWII